jgi:ribosomal protein L11 methyltransferase
MVEDEDWLRVWKEGWRPTEHGRQLVVLPAWWAEPVAGARIAVRIDPGRAFGTGTHVTTALAWELLEPCLSDARRLLDVGSGSGVLALGALAYAPSLRVVTTEADRDAIPSMLENLALNAARGRAEVVHCMTVPFAGASFDLAVANLTAREHVAVDRDLHRVLAPGARVVLSGLRDEQAAEASARWRDRGYVPETELRRDTWVAFRCRRP